MGFIAEDTVTDIVIVRGLDVIENDDVFEFSGISYNAVFAYQCASSYESTMAHFGIFAYNAR